MKHWHKTEGYLLDQRWPNQPFGEGIEKLVLAGRTTEAVEFCVLVQQIVTEAMAKLSISEFAAVTSKYDFKIANLGECGSGLVVDLGQDAPFQWLFSRVPLPQTGSMSK
jgi:hypothetical protein